MTCWRCFFPIEIKKLSFREQCPKCGVDLHVCLACRFYFPGKPNDCAVPGTDWVRERDRMNLCDEFSVKLQSEKKSPEEDAKIRAKKILGFDE